MYENFYVFIAQKGFGIKADETSTQQTGIRATKSLKVNLTFDATVVQ